MLWFVTLLNIGLLVALCFVLLDAISVRRKLRYYQQETIRLGSRLVEEMREATWWLQMTHEVLQEVHNKALWDKAIAHILTMSAIREENKSNEAQSKSADQ